MNSHRVTGGAGRSAHCDSLCRQQSAVRLTSRAKRIAAGKVTGRVEIGERPSSGLRPSSLRPGRSNQQNPSVCDSTPNQWIHPGRSESPRRGRRSFAVASAVACAAAVWCTAIHARAAEEQASTYSEPPLTETDRDHWAFRPVDRVPVPAVSDSAWPRNEIDHFVWSSLARRQLIPQPAPSAEILIRRLSFDLIGLPPSPEEIDAFASSTDEDAWRQLVERLLASPRYGERWAQHWLDLARFAETDGFEHDKVRPEAWKYRDWVIQALNADMPYDEFVRLQIAGDEIHPGDESAATATRFCLSGPDMPDINLLEERRHTLLNEIVGTVGETILGLQIGCAQCHDHQYDAISQADFYRLRAIFEPSVQLRRNVSVSELQTQRPYERTSHLMIRGDFRRPGPQVSPGVLRVLTSGGRTFELPDADGESGRRSRFARWLVDSSNPLTARVIVNRVWQHHFGIGLVSTPSDFGVMGSEPSHPQLLDWLAGFLVDNDWSLKQLHRHIVTSATYRQRSYLPLNATDDERAVWKTALETDPQGIQLSRYKRRRLEGEAIRDAILASSGQLNLKAGGVGVRPPLPLELVGTLLKNQWNVTADPAEHTRRSIYLFARRNLRFPILEMFDRPSANASCGLRNVSTTAPQSLHLLNSKFTLTMAQEMSRMIAEREPDRTAQIQSAFRRSLGRHATDEELGEVLQLWGGSVSGASGSAEPLTHLCLSLFNSNEFVFVD